MSAFESYSSYYDLLYNDKNYGREVEYVHELILKYHPSTKSILELGCGTGIHASLLCDKNFNVTGVDKSAEMLKIAEKKLEGSDLKLIEADIIVFRNGQKFDTAISLFHVMSYMPDINMLTAAFKTAGAHLPARGLFIFDCWHGPAVLEEQPGPRKKEFENENISVVRRSESEWIKEKNLVNVNFEITITKKLNGEKEIIKELHPMRYWFENEITGALNNSGFELLKAEEWLSGNALSNKSWNACYIARKIN